MRVSPIVMFIYNRPRHTALALKSLLRNDQAKESELFIYCDGPKNDADAVNVDLARQAVRKALGGFRRVTVRENKANAGLAKSVIRGVSEVVADVGRVIALEDDLVLAKGFLPFMNALLDRYQDEERVFTASGYIFPHTPIPGYPHDVVALPRCSTWGWATWRDRWEKADWEQRGLAQRLNDPGYRQLLARGGSDMVSLVEALLDGRVDSWGIPWCLTHLEHNAQIAFAVKNRVLNIGMDGSGRHCQPGCQSSRKLHNEPDELVLACPLEDDTDLAKRVMTFF